MVLLDGLTIPFNFNDIWTLAMSFLTTGFVGALMSAMLALLLMFTAGSLIFALVNRR